MLVVEKRKLEGNYDVLDYNGLARVPLTRAAAGADGREHWSGHFRFDAPAVYGYWFEVKVGGRTLVFENNATPVYWTQEKGAGGAGVIAEMPSQARRIRRYRQTVYAPYDVPTWAKDAVYYYIFPERFRNGDTRNDEKPGVDRFHDKTVEFPQELERQALATALGRRQRRRLQQRLLRRRHRRHHREARLHPERRRQHALHHADVHGRQQPQVRHRGLEAHRPSLRQQRRLRAPVSRGRETRHPRAARRVAEPQRRRLDLLRPLRPRAAARARSRAARSTRPRPMRAGTRSIRSRPIPTSSSRAGSA